jgi:hypothetical protein
VYFFKFKIKYVFLRTGSTIVGKFIKDLCDFVVNSVQVYCKVD